MGTINHETELQIGATLQGGSTQFEFSDFHLTVWDINEKDFKDYSDFSRYHPDLQDPGHEAYAARTADNNVRFDYFPRIDGDIFANMVAIDPNSQRAVEYRLLEPSDSALPRSIFKDKVLIQREVTDMESGRSLKDCQRTSNNPSRTFRALARLARIAPLVHEIEANNPDRTDPYWLTH